MYLLSQLVERHFLCILYFTVVFSLDAQGAQDDGEVPAKKLKTDANDNGGKSETSSAETPSNKATSSKDSKKTEEEPQPSTSTAADAAGKTPKAKGEEEKKTENGNIYICQYCDREFPSSKLLIAHEMQHLIGNHFEVRSCT